MSNHFIDDTGATIPYVGIKGTTGVPPVTTVDAFGSEQVVIYDASGSPVSYVVDAEGRSLVRSSGYGFDVPVVAATSTFATPYTAGDIMGALLTFADVAPWATAPVMITGAQVAFKVAVAPSPLSLILFNADPSATTKTDNAAYSLAAADAAKVIKSINFQALGGVYYDHGTPNSISVDNLGVACVPVATSLYGLLVDGTGVTLSSATDVQVRLRGFAI